MKVQLIKIISSVFACCSWSLLFIYFCYFHILKRKKPFPPFTVLHPYGLCKWNLCAQVEQKFNVQHYPSKKRMKLLLVDAEVTFLWFKFLFSILILLQKYSLSESLKRGIRYEPYYFNICNIFIFFNWSNYNLFFIFLWFIFRNIGVHRRESYWQ